MKCILHFELMETKNMGSLKDGCALTVFLTVFSHAKTNKRTELSARHSKKAGQKKKKYLPTSNEEQPKDSVSSFDMFHKNQNKSKNASNRGSIYITYN